MPVTYERFVEAVLAAKLVAPDELRRVEAMLAQAGDVNELAHLLVREGKLTKYQATAVYQDKIGTLTLSNYIILDRLGAGGMGQVYRARHRTMDRVVAIKILSKKMLSSPEAVERFQREVKAAARLAHPNIVTAFDADEAEGTHFLVMEYVEGNDLSQLVKQRGPLTIAEAVEYVRHAATGLAHAHDAGIIHRDIKPSNLLVDKRGAVKILDMGLARIDGQADSTKVDAGLTQHGSIMGTVDFMAPEQAIDTHVVDARADLYSLGCTLHYLLIGRAPFGGDSVMSRLLAHRDAPIPSLRALRGDVPDSLDAIFQRLIAKDANHRFQSAQELLDALAKPSAVPQPTRAAPLPKAAASSTPKTAKRKKSNAMAGVIGIVGLVLGGLGGLSLAYLLLVYMRGPAGDFLRIFPQSQGPVAQRAEAPTRTEPTAQPEKPAAPKNDAVSPPVATPPPSTPSVASEAPKMETNPTPNVEPPPEPTPTAMPAPVEGVATVDSPMESAPPETPDDTTVTSSEPEKLPIPDDDAVAKAETLVKEIFKDDLAAAKTSDAKLVLAEKMLDAAQQNTDDAVGRYAMLCQARDLAIDGTSPPTVLRVIQTIDDNYAIDPSELTVRALEKMVAKPTVTTTTAKEIATAAMGRVDDAAGNDDWPLAKRFSDVALAAARKSKDAMLTKQTFDQAKILTAAKQQFDAAEAARAKLDDDENDPAANLVLGKYLCFVKEDWTEGFEHLSRSNDKMLKELGVKSVEVPDSPEARAQLGDAWWDAGEKAKGKDREQLRAAAGYWYSSAAEGLSGLSKARVEKRLADISAQANSTRAMTAKKSTQAVGNGLSIPEVIDCAPAARKITYGSTFDFEKSWTLSLDFMAPHFNAGRHHVLRVASPQGGEPLVVRLDGPKLEVLVAADERGKNTTFAVPLASQAIGNWVSISLQYEAASKEVVLFVQRQLVGKQRVMMIAPRAEQPVLFVGGATTADGKNRFLGRVRNLWLGNKGATAAPAVAATPSTPATVAATGPVQGRSAANGVSIPGPIDCSARTQEFKLSPAFDDIKSWTLRFEVLATEGFGDSVQRLLEWGSGDGQRYVTAFSAQAAAHTAPNGVRNRIETRIPLNPNWMGTWVSFVVHYDAAHNELAIYINDTAGEKRSRDLKPSPSDAKQVLFGGTSNGRQRYRGQIRSVWLGNDENFTPPVTTPATKPGASTPPPTDSANGIVVPGELDCSQRSHEFKLGPTFDDTKSWTLRCDIMEAGAFGDTIERVIGWGDADVERRLGVFRGKAKANIGVAESPDHIEVVASLDDKWLRTWISFVIHYDAASNEMSLFVNNTLSDTKRNDAKLSSSGAREVVIGATSDGKRRFRGQIRSIWLGNEDTFTPPKAPASEPSEPPGP